MTILAARGFALTLVALVVATPGVAKDKKPVDPTKRVCRSEVPTGSFMAKSICHTVADWAQIDAANAGSTQALDRANHSGLAGAASDVR